MRPMTTLAWVAIAVCFLRGLLAFDMGSSVKGYDGIVGGLCLAASVVAAAILASSQEKASENDSGV